MRRILALVLALAVCLGAMAALAEENQSISMTMAGFDGDNSGHDWTTNLFFRRMEERTGLSFTYEQYTDYDEWTSAKETLLASADKPEVLFKAELTPQEQQTYYDNGTLIDLRPYLAEYAPNLSALLAAHPEWEQAISLPDGAIVALPTINELQNNNAMWINRTWLDALGLDMPTTAEELTEVLRAFKTRDPNGNGQADEVPLTFMGMWDLKFLGHAFGLVADDYNLYLDDSGKVCTTLDTDENRAFLTWLNRLWTEGLLAQDGFITADTLRQVTDANATITYGMMLAPTPLTLVTSSALGQYELLMPMIYEGKQGYRDLLGDVVRGTFAITSACKDPAALVSWIDYLYTKEGCMLAQAGLEGVEYEVNEDGTWSWIADNETVSTVLENAAISEGGNTPGLAAVEVQLTYDSTDTHALIEALCNLKAVSREPMPTVWLTEAAQAEVDAIQLDLGSYAERAMIHFVTGDTPINDETWATFCQTVNDKGMPRLIEIMQNAVQ